MYKNATKNLISNLFFIYETDESNILLLNIFTNISE